MKKLSCVIVDDEPIARKILREFVADVQFLSLKGESENALKAEEFLQHNAVDILFLDIEMPRLNGLDYLKNSSVKPVVILTTAFPEYALEGYELDIIDYLLKPISFTRFLKAVSKAREYCLLKYPGQPGQSHSWLFVRSDRRIEKVELNEILYVESLGNYVNIYVSGKKIIAYLTLKGIEEQLPADDFIKIHQSYLVNRSRITAIEGNQVKIGQVELPVGRNFKNDLMQMVEQRLLKR